MAYGQKRLNRDDVRRGTRNFILWFLILCGMTFCTVFLFFKNAQIQNKDLVQKKRDYDNVLKNSNLLNIKMEGIYHTMEEMSDDDLRTDNFLIVPVSKELKEAAIFIGEDSVKNLKHMSLLIRQIEPMIDYKSELQAKISEEQNTIKMLNDCRNRANKVNTIIQKVNKPDGTIYNR